MPFTLSIAQFILGRPPNHRVYSSGLASIDLMISRNDGIASHGLD